MCVRARPNTTPMFDWLQALCLARRTIHNIHCSVQPYRSGICTSPIGFARELALKHACHACRGHPYSGRHLPKGWVGGQKIYLLQSLGTPLEHHTRPPLRAVRQYTDYGIMVHALAESRTLNHRVNSLQFHLRIWRET